MSTPVEAIDALYARWRPVYAKSLYALASVVTGSGIYVVSGSGKVAPKATASTYWDPFYIDPAAEPLTATNRSTRFRLVAAIGVNDNAPARTFKPGLYPVGTPSGSTDVFDQNVGTVTAEISDAAFTSPAANSTSALVDSSEFTIAAAGWYTVAVTASGAMAANSVAVIPLRLEARFT